jgi:CBS domain-containing protein
MKTVRDILRVKGYDVWSIGPDATVFDALQLMAEKSIGAVVVLDSGKLVGILSERDYARKVILKGKASREIPVREIMTKDVVCVRPDMLIEACMKLMTDKRIRHLPVLEGDRLIGVISIGDVVKAVISEQELLIEQLGSYIWGGPLPSRKPEGPG